MKRAWAEGAPAVVRWCSSTHPAQRRSRAAHRRGYAAVSMSLLHSDVWLHVWTGSHYPFLDTPFLDSLISVAPFHRRNIHGATIITSICSL